MTEQPPPDEPSAEPVDLKPAGRKRLARRVAAMGGAFALALFIACLIWPDIIPALTVALIALHLVTGRGPDG